MAWFPCNLGGGSTPQSKSVSYLKWQITKVRGNPPASSSLQMAEFYVYKGSTKYTWHNSVSISSDLQGTSGETVDKLIDSNINTKYNTSAWGSSQTAECNIVISLGETIVLDKHDGYSFVTANDESSRDPISWKVYGSTDGSNWFLLDEVDDANITNDRQTETQKFKFNELVALVGNATKVEGQFTSASTEFGIVNVSVGFKPDLVMVLMKLGGTGQDTCSFWEKDASYAETHAIWTLYPAEQATYYNELGREYGEAGIQQINNDGFSYMSNGVNTRSVVCRYVAVKYESTPELLQFKNYAKFGGNNGILLPFLINADYKVTVVFYETSYANDSAIIGNTQGSGKSHLTEYSNKWYTSSGSSEVNFGSWVGGVDHTYITNNGNNKNELDGVEVTNYTPQTDNNTYYTIACRSNTGSNKWAGYLKLYKIESISSGNVICELKPCLFDNLTPCLYDTINKKFYYTDLTVMDTIPTT